MNKLFLTCLFILIVFCQSSHADISGHDYQQQFEMDLDYDGNVEHVVVYEGKNENDEDVCVLHLSNTSLHIVRVVQSRVPRSGCSITPVQIYSTLPYYIALIADPLGYEADLTLLLFDQLKEVNRNQLFDIFLTQVFQTTMASSKVVVQDRTGDDVKEIIIKQRDNVSEYEEVFMFDEITSKWVLLENNFEKSEGDY